MYETLSSAAGEKSIGSVTDSDLKQSARQRRRRCSFKYKFIFLVKISRMAGCVYRLSRHYTSTSLKRYVSARWKLR